MKNTRTENDILFSCTLDLLTGDPLAHGEVYSFVDDYFLSKGVEYRNNFSNDNMLSIFCWCNKFDKEYIKELPLFGHFSIHPFRFPFYFYAKYPLIGFWFMPLVSLSMIVGALRMKRNGVIHTSGLILSFIKFRAFKMPFTEWVINKRVNSYPELKGWDEVFRIYHGKDRLHIYAAYKNWEKRND